MNFSYNNFSCDIEMLKNDNNYIFRLFDSKQQIHESQLHDLVIVDSGYGFICVETFTDSYTGLISGYLNSKYFSIEGIVEKLVDKIEDILGLEGSYYHIDIVESQKYVEYNGEY